MSYTSLIAAELNQAAAVLNQFLADEHNLKNIEAAARLISEAIKKEGK